MSASVANTIRMNAICSVQKDECIGSKHPRVNAMCSVQTEQIK